MVPVRELALQAPATAGTVIMSNVAMVPVRELALQEQLELAHFDPFPGLHRGRFGNMACKKWLGLILMFSLIGGVALPRMLANDATLPVAC
jgi:hypothetical protein